jgi:hypothetical protein
MMAGIGMSSFFRMRSSFLAIAAALASFFCSAAEWENLDDAHRVAGRKLSSAYMVGKVVLVSRDASQAARLQDVWSSFKGKSFILLGSYEKSPEGISFPVYADAGLVSAPAGPLYVVDALGNPVYYGAEVPEAIEAAVIAITDLASPSDYLEWKRYFEFEAKELPGRAINRLAAIKTDKKLAKIAFSPAEKEERAEAEKALKSNPVYARLAKLEAFSAAAKDRPASSKQKRARIGKMQVRSEIRKYADLKKHEDSIVAREAKNCLADLVYVEAEL